MNKKMKIKLIMFVSMVAFTAFYWIAFGSKNMVLGLMIVMATFVNLKNDLSFKPKESFLKVLFLFLTLGVVSFLNNPITIEGCILTFFVVFGTTFSSYHLFGSNVFRPFLIMYFVMLCSPLSAEKMYLRFLALIVGAIFFVGVNLIVNRKKVYKLTKQTLDDLIEEMKNAIDLKLNGKEVLKENFKVSNGFYSAIYSKFGYKYFPTPRQISVLNVIKAFQFTGIVIADYDLTSDELNYIRQKLEDIKNNQFSNIFEGISVKTKEMNLALLNLEIIAEEVKNKDLIENNFVFDKEAIKFSLNSIIKRGLSFRSVKFAFAFKMALVLTLWEVLTLLFNLPYTNGYILYPLH